MRRFSAAIGLASLLWLATGGYAQAPKQPLPDHALARIGSGQLRHDVYLGDLLFSSDGTRLVSFSTRSRIVRIWDVKSGQLLHELPGTVAALSPDGKLIATTSGAEVLVHATDRLAEKPVQTIPLKGAGLIARLAFSPDSKVLAMACRTPYRVRLWNVETRSELREFPTTILQNCLAFSPDGKYLLTSYLTGVWVWEVATGKQVRQHTLRTHRAAFSSDSATVVATEKPLRAWDVATGKEKWAIEGGTEAKGIALSADGKTAVVGDITSTVSVWDLETRKQKWSQKAADTATLPNMQAVAISPDGKIVATGTQQSIRLWNAATGEELPQSRRDPLSLGPIAISPDGEQLAAGVQFQADNDNTQNVVIYDAATGKEATRLKEALKGPIANIEYSPNGKWLAAHDQTGAIQIWDAATLQPVKQLSMEAGAARVLAFTADSERLVGATTVKLHLWNVADWREMPVSDERPGINVTPLGDGGSFATATGSMLSVFDEMGRKRDDFNLSMNLLKVSASPDGRMLLARSSAPVQVTVLETATWKPRASWPVVLTDVAAMQFLSPRMVVTGGKDGALTLRAIRSGTVLQQYKGHTDGVVEIVASRDGRRMASRGNDQVVLVWDTQNWIDNFPPPQGRDTDLAEAWEALHGNDAAQAYQALGNIAAKADAGVQFIAARLKPVTTPEVGRVPELIKKLNAESYREREEATEELMQLAEFAESALKAAVESDLPEVRYRAARILVGRSLSLPPGDARALEALEHIGTDAAREFVKRLAAGTPGALLTQQSQRVLARWDDGK